MFFPPSKTCLVPNSFMEIIKDCFNKINTEPRNKCHFPVDIKKHYCRSYNDSNYFPRDCFYKCS